MGHPIARGVQGQHNTGTIPASTGGINASAGFDGMTQKEAIYLFNIMPDEYGLTTRKGYVEWANGMVSEVRTIIPYKAANNPANDRLFAVTELGIYDITTSGTVGAPVQDFLVQGPDSGFGVYMAYTTAAEELFLYYADEANGLFLYNSSTDLWAQAPDFLNPGGEQPPLAVDIVFIVQHKLRVWFFGRNATNVWYLDIQAVDGVAEEFFLGGKYPHGGQTVGLWNWTIDGGEGVDDYLVMISEAGDVLPFRGDDPSSSLTWSSVGTYFIAEMPKSRRCVREYGADMYILCAFGIISMNDLIRGVLPADNPATPAYKVQALVREEVQASLDSHVWEIKLNPTDNSMFINGPQRNQTDGNYWQFGMDVTIKAWGIWRDVPIITSDTWKAEYFFGDPVGRVFRMDGSRDGDLLDGTLGEPVAFSGLTSFQNLDSPGIYKRCSLLRAKGLTGGDIQINLKPFYDYALQTTINAPPITSANSLGRWDISAWDNAIWAGLWGGAGKVQGGSGMGTTVAIAFKGQAGERGTIAAWDVTWDGGSFL
jgi:hypothetical protein